MSHPVLVVGAGFAGSVISRQLADRGHDVVTVDRREHIGGNAYDELDANGVLVHRYGPHIFHTNSERIFEFLSRFTDWYSYEHRVLSSVGGHLYPFPINLTTVNRLYSLNLDSAGVAAFFERVREPRAPIRSSEDLVLDSVGRDLYERFFLNYTLKQWGLHPSSLKAGVAARVPVRTSEDDRYFTDAFQGMPLKGYTEMFRNLLDHPRITLELATGYEQVRDRVAWRHTVYTGPIDAFFGYSRGKLPYRSLRFEHEHLPGLARFQPVGTVNYPNEHAFTRITEFKHLTGQQHSGTSIVREYPQSEGDPYYPIPSEENERRFKEYEALALQQRDLTFVGRLAQYRYYNMDQVVGAALKAAERITEGL